MNRRFRRNLTALPTLLALSCGGAVSQQPSHPSDAGPGADATAPDAASPPADGSSKTSDANTQLTDASLMDTGPGEDSASGGDARIADATNIHDGSAEAASADDASVPISCGETASCLSPISLGTVPGGEGYESGSAGTGGTHSDWYQIQIVQPPAGVPRNSPITIVVVYEYPANSNFELDVYENSSGPPSTCTQPAAILTSDAGAETVSHFSVSNDGAPSVLGWLTLHIVAQPGSQCFSASAWGFTVYSE